MTPDMHNNSNTFSDVSYSKLPSLKTVMDRRVVHMNEPLLMQTYKDPNTHQEMLILAVLMHSGVTNVTFDLNSDGTQATITYNWPKVMFNVDNMFSKLVNNGTIPAYHPKIMALENELETTRKSKIEIPIAQTIINLLIKVETSISSFVKYGVKRPDGFQVLIIELAGLSSNYSKDIKIIEFE
jgi:hypothetical protein